MTAHVTPGMSDMEWELPPAEGRLGNSNGEQIYLQERPLLEQPRGRAGGRDKRMSRDVAAGKVWEWWRGNLTRISRQHVP